VYEQLRYFFAFLFSILSSSLCIFSFSLPSPSKREEEGRRERNGAHTENQQHLSPRPKRFIVVKKQKKTSPGRKE
jgi:hypothetical protein